MPSQLEISAVALARAVADNAALAHHFRLNGQEISTERLRDLSELANALVSALTGNTAINEL